MNSIRAEKQIVFWTTRASDSADLFAIDEQRQAVEELEDRVPRLVDGQDDGAAVVRHPGHTETNVSSSVWVKRVSTLGNMHLLSSSSTELAVLASRPVVGSSRKSTDGLMISSMPMLVRFLSPPEIPRISWVPTWKHTQESWWLELLMSSFFPCHCFSETWFMLTVHLFTVSLEEKSK